MPYLVSALGSLLLWAGGKLVGRILLGLGVGVVAYTGASALVSALQSLIAAQLGGVGGQYVEAMSYLGFNESVSIITGAYLAKIGTQTAYKLALRRAA